jgi:hypothetical protein
MRLNGNRHRAMMAMAATGILTALAPAAPATAEEGPSSGDFSVSNVAVTDVGIRTAMGDKVVDAAYAELNSDRKYESPMGSNCNYYSRTLGHGCQAWCADFVKVVWKNAGVFAWESLDSEAGTTARYGNFFGTWHPGTTAGIYPGAAVTYDESNNPLVNADHVGIFVGWVNGAPKVVSGNYSNQVYKHNLHYGTPYRGWTGIG